MAHMAQQVPAPEVQRIPVDEARQKQERGEAVILDVRRRDAYEEAHVKGAIHMPSTEIPRRYQELPLEKEIITY